MKIKKNLQIINEGKTNILVYKNNKNEKGPGTKSDKPFYNPSMEMNRDLSIAINQWLIDNNKNEIQILDGLASTGIRGIRFANELNGNFKVTINDWSNPAYELIQKNIKNNKLTNSIAENKNLNSLLSEKKYDYIDIDPFGSPAYFIDSAVRNINKNGIIACTATDTATLCGVYPKVCCRRYGVRSFHSSIMHEIGLRILIGFICRESAKYDLGIDPLLSYNTDHYFRTYIKIKKGIKHANKSIDKLKSIDSKIILPLNNKINNIGPIWLGNIGKKQFIHEIISYILQLELNTKGKLLQLLNLLENESEKNPFFYISDNIASSLNTSVPSMKYISKKLQENKYYFVKTHFKTNGFKTNAPIEIIKRIFKNQE